MKPFSLYIFRHTALTHKSAFLKEHILRDHAGWSMTSKMPQVYLHYFGTESANSILEAYGIIKNESPGANLLKPIQCPNCHESNNKETRICVSCKMILKYDAYAEALDDKESKEKEVLKLKESFNNEMIKMKEQITEDLKKEVRELLTRLKPEVIKEGL